MKNFQYVLEWTEEYIVSTEQICMEFRIYLFVKLRLANYGLWAKSSPKPVFVNKALLEHSRLVYLLFITAFAPQWQN